MAKEKNKLSPYLLFIIASLLLTAAWLMKSFPVFIFAGLAPLFAITDHAQKENVWNKLELVGIALTISFLAGQVFEVSSLIYAMIQAIVITLGFVVFTFTRQSLGTRLGKLPLILFWLALEYSFLKLHVTDDVLFLADSLQLKTEWFQWTEKTGYIGVSFWILMANLIFYHGIFQQGVRLPYLIAFLIVVGAPIVYSYALSVEVFIDRNMMSTFYQDKIVSSIPSFYQEKGEWIPRTAAWISVLIILFASVKNYTRKK
jgi:hypothetical protein